jgi:hypothetical protein
MSNINVTAETGLKCICFYIHPSLNSCWSEVIWLCPAGGMTWDRSELFPSPVSQEFRPPPTISPPEGEIPRQLAPF